MSHALHITIPAEDLGFEPVTSRELWLMKCAARAAITADRTALLRQLPRHVQLAVVRALENAYKEPDR